MEKYCLKCGKGFEKRRKDSNKQWEMKLYCSRGCASKRKIIRKKTSEVTKRKQSEAHKNCIFTELHRKRLSESAKRREQKPLTEEHKKNISKSMYGEKNHQWKGGISFIPYCFRFNGILKEEVRNRDNMKCQICDKTQEENKRKLDVHHIHYDKENCYPDLIALCRNCNVIVNFNRKYWENIFMNKLNNKNMLFWTRNYLIS